MLSETAATFLARLGFAARGLVYLLIGWFAVDAALRGGQTADNHGAIASLADEPFGPVLLAVIAAGLAGYALWRLAEAIANPEQIKRDPKGSLKRIAMATSGAIYAGLAWTAVRLAIHAHASRGDASPNDTRARHWTAWLLDQPLGVWLLGAIAIGFLCGAGYQFWKAWKGKFFEHMQGDAPGWLCMLGRIGYCARGVVFATIGCFLASAAWHVRASEAGATGDALAALKDQPGGPWLLVATGVGLGLFGLYSLAEARYRRIRVRI